MNREKTIANITYALPELDDAGLLATEDFIANMGRRDLSSAALARAQFERDQVAQRVEDFDGFFEVDDGR